MIRFQRGDEQIPHFDTKEQCQIYVDHHMSGGSNPAYPHLNQSISVLVSWKQIEQEFLSKHEQSKELQNSSVSKTDQASQDKPHETNETYLDEVSKKWDSRVTEEEKEFLDSKIPKELREHIVFRCLSSTFCRQGCQAVENTLRYLFFHFRSGIYVELTNNRLEWFVPFANRFYVNNFHSELRCRNPQGWEAYFHAKQSRFKRFKSQQFIHPRFWWANGRVLHTFQKRLITGDHSLVQYRDMLIELCSNQNIPDVKFFINTTDHPCLKQDLSEPFDFIFGKKTELKRHKYSFYAPILSGYSNSYFADLLIPTALDWELATGKVFPRDCRDLASARNLLNYRVSWRDKIPIAFFRGSATGSGTTRETNQRINLCCLSKEWKLQGLNILDAELTDWNPRDKIQNDKSLAYIDPETIDLSLGEPVPIYRQSKFKFLICAEGHSSASRLPVLMKTGSLILFVEHSFGQRETFFDQFVTPWKHVVPIASDLSDLQAKINWCVE